MCIRLKPKTHFLASSCNSYLVAKQRSLPTWLCPLLLPRKTKTVLWLSSSCDLNSACVGQLVTPSGPTLESQIQAFCVPASSYCAPDKNFVSYVDVHECVFQLELGSVDLDRDDTPSMMALITKIPYFFPPQLMQ